MTDHIVQVDGQEYRAMKAETHYAGLLESTGAILLDASHQLDAALDREKDTARKLQAVRNSVEKYRSAVARAIAVLESLSYDLEGADKDSTLHCIETLRTSLHTQEIPF